MTVSSFRAFARAVTGGLGFSGCAACHQTNILSFAASSNKRTPLQAQALPSGCTAWYGTYTQDGMLCMGKPAYHMAYGTRPLGPTYKHRRRVATSDMSYVISAYVGPPPDRVDTYRVEGKHTVIHAAHGWCSAMKGAC